MTARRLSIQSTTSFGSFPGHASTPTGSRSLAENRCAHDDRLAPGRELLDLARDGQWVEEQQAIAVVDRVGRDQRGGSGAVNLLPRQSSFEPTQLAARVMPHTGATVAAE